MVSAGSGANAVDLAATQSQQQSDAFSAYQTAVSDVGLRQQAGMLTAAQAAAQDRSLGQKALAGGFGSLTAT